MDVYQYVNSKDIRAHLESIGYQFNALEAAWLVYQHRGITMDERHAAWREIIDTMPDMRVEYADDSRKLKDASAKIQSSIAELEDEFKDRLSDLKQKFDAEIRRMDEEYTTLDDEYTRQIESNKESLREEEMTGLPEEELRREG